MNWIFDNLQIVAIVLLGVASAVKSMLDAVARKKAERETYEGTEPEVPLDEDTSYRKPTIPSLTPGTPPALRIAGYEADAAEEAAMALKHQQELAARLRQIRETKATTTGGATATRARVAGKGAVKAPSKAPLTLRQRLASPAEVRQAFVLREILDTPVGLREKEQDGY